MEILWLNLPPSDTSEEGGSRQNRDKKRADSRAKIGEKSAQILVSEQYQHTEVKIQTKEGILKN